MLRITADRIKIWKNQKEDGTYNFTYSISSKNQDGTYSYMSKKVRFMKDKEPEDSCEIMIKDAFQSFFTMNEKQYDYLMILDYELLSESKSVSSEEVVIEDDDLPF
jgi:hypothetical protein